MASFGKRQEAQQQQLDQLDQLVSGGSLRTALAFGVLGLLAALILAPALDTQSLDVATISTEDLPVGIDRTVTGSVQPAAQPLAEPGVAPRNGTVRYTIRRSVIQQDPAEPCYIFEDGTSHGGC